MPTRPETTATGTSVDNVLDVEDLRVHFDLSGGALSRLLGRRPKVVKAVDGVDLHLRRGEVLGLVGESGSGKTTLGRALLGLVPATSGRITHHGRGEGSGRKDTVVTDLSEGRLRSLRTQVQMVFQDPNAALNPSMDIQTAVGHPLKVHGLASGDELRRRVVDALERVGLSPVDRFLEAMPSDLSGGQKQRAVIARAIILDPELVVADEPISMLDMSVRAKILQLMLDLKQELDLTYVYITHDLASAKFFCDRIAIMYLGRIVEIGPTEEVFADPKHPYTRALLRAIPEPDPDRSLPRDLPRGEIPDAASPPLGCAFHPRCPDATPVCGWEARDLRALLEAHWVRSPPEEFEREQALVGDLDVLDAPAKTVRLAPGSGRPAGEVRDLIERVRAEDEEDPFWRGVARVEEVAGGVEVEFHDGVDPLLRRTGGVDVACVLHPEPVTTDPCRPDVERA
ncbi:ABC transporter ATP-binding protein [Nocardioides sp. SYSU DS0663]|uniref:ABC transporter ATP-binding protein n=1 Tax=Nocardioides sp. SYSU DS0663 TaxID=3416445 RepID=UPI003F4BD261